ncbi:hypothetical protein [Demequina litorisediminis]|uniref:Uncharacterized protein n=1 Tax=Demequina litorisediminis TaxID=1849022 RepID=A0ABQ6ICZ7_9MICO|nr:hypothetical protein [Demequina litorisediminis]GMA34882.1 hypothetical protein GCM10025876_10860 [Demequina litorisediminis]
MWSTKYFEVTTEASAKTNIKSPGVKEVSSANCEAHGAGESGFTITNTRTVKARRRGGRGGAVHLDLPAQ